MEQETKQKINNEEVKENVAKTKNNLLFLDLQ